MRSPTVVMPSFASSFVRAGPAPFRNCTLCSRGDMGPSGPLCERHVLDVGLADVDLLGAEDAVVLQLLQPVCQPAGDAADREEGREQVARDAERLVDDA